MADRHIESRIVRLASPNLDASRVQVRRVVGREAISQPFAFDIDLFVEGRDGLDVDKLMGAPASLVFEHDRKDTRAVHGMITSLVDPLEVDAMGRFYSVKLVPRLHRLTMIQTQEVFLNIAVPDLIKQKLSLVGIGASDLDLRLLEKYPAREIVVQYRETDLAFVSRLAEHLGVSYYFDHESGKDKVVFTDYGTGFARIDRQPTMAYRGRGDRSDVYRLEAQRHLFPMSYVVQDYDYRAPQLELTSTHEHPEGYAGGVAEYGSHHRTPAEGDRLAKIRAEESDVRHRFFVGESDLDELTAGAIVKLTDHPLLDDTYLLIVEVEHKATQAVSMHAHDGSEGYRNTFKAVDASRAYRPPLVTPRPRIHGVLTGITEPVRTGVSRKLPQIDEHGRYTVRFFFDTAGERRRSSAPMRMAQPHAGQDYGVHFPLKPGVEVTVTFADGDPDRPIISGAVPNPITGSPVTNRHITLNRIKTVSGAIIEIKDD